MSERANIIWDVDAGTLISSAASRPELDIRIDAGLNAASLSGRHSSKLEESPCPFLGFVDERNHHYSRPTVLHRCYASDSPDLISPVEQRSMCISGQHASCGRFIAAVGSDRLEPIRAHPTTALVVVPHTGPSRRWRSRFIVLLMGTIGGFLLLLVIGALFLLAPLALGPLGASPLNEIPLTGIAATDAAPDAVDDASSLRDPANAVTHTDPSVVPAVVAPTPPLTSGPPLPTLLNRRLITAPPPDWKSVPPYASWNNGAYRLQARDQGRFVAVTAPISQGLADVVVSARLRKTGGPSGGGYGLIIRQQGTDVMNGINQFFSGYVLEAGDRGEVGIWRRDRDRWTDLVSWVPSTAVQTGGTANDLTVSATSDRLALMVNGVEVAQARDATFTSGGVGVFVGGDGNQVELDNVVIQGRE